MLVQNLFLTVALSATALAVGNNVDADDIPYQCRDVCMDVVSLTKKCDVQSYGPNDDAAELNCICTAPNASSQIPLCEACVSQYDEDGPDNDVNDLVRKCGFSYASYNTANPPVPSSAAPTSSPVPVSSAPGYGSAPAAPPASSAPAPPAQPTGTGSGPGPAPTGGYNGTASGAPAPPFGNPTQSSAAQLPTGAASVNGVGAAGVGLGAIGFVLGMM